MPKRVLFQYDLAFAEQRHDCDSISGEGKRRAPISFVKKKKKKKTLRPFDYTRRDVNTEDEIWNEVSVRVILIFR